jgi:hypothetical protein
MDAELLDRPVGQGLRAQQSQPPTATTIIILPEEAVAAGIVGRPLTHVRPVEQPTLDRPTGRLPWASLVLSAASLALVGGLLAVLAVPAVIGSAVTVCLALSCLVLVIAETVSKASR